MKTYKFKGKSIYFKKTTYLNNGTLAIQAYECDTNDPYFTLTVNINESGFFGNEEVAFLDVNNVPDIEKWVKARKIAKYVGLNGFSGFVSYPLYHFSKEFLDSLEEM